jgi:REP element-mobilizing transposase RayT
MGGYQIRDQKAAYYLTLQVVNWIDLFTRDDYRQIVVESLRYCQENKGLELFAWVLMSNHIHLIARSEKGELSGTIRDFKSYTSKRIIQRITEGPESRSGWMLNLFKCAAEKHQRNTLYQVWTHENHAVELVSNVFVWEKLEYLHNNPVRNGIVKNIWEYRYSSALNYADMEGELEVIKLSPRLRTY